jgi:hypothetical protein
MLAGNPEDDARDFAFERRVTRREGLGPDALFSARLRSGQGKLIFGLYLDNSHLSK